jgi:8-oxo-dGTP pyrophosphatase MutT (NUDIX family)
MEAQEIIDLLNAYSPTDGTTAQFKADMLAFVQSTPLFAAREHLPGHFTAAAWVLNQTRTHALLIHHKKLDRWLQMGGHVEPSDKHIWETALREAQEESGLAQISLLSQAIFDIDIHEIPEKNGVPAHLHYDIRFLCEADSQAMLQANNEVKAIEWFPLLALANAPASLRRMVEKSA